MSRTIGAKASVTMTESDIQLRKTDSGKLLFTSYRGQNCALLIQGDRLMEASFFPKKPSKIGAIYIGKVKSIVKNIDACFVEIDQGELCFLPFKSASVVQLLNRCYDGRILEGDELLVQVVRDAQKAKRASVTTEISMSSDYFVMTMGHRKVCYSTKLSQRRKEAIGKLLKEDGCLEQDGMLLLSETLPMKGQELPPTGMIVRTKAEELESGEELIGKLHEILERYVRLLHIARYRSCFSCLVRAETEVVSAMRQFAADMESIEIITDQPAFYEELQGICGLGGNGSSREKDHFHGICQGDSIFQGREVDVRLYTDSALSLSALYSIQNKLKSALESKVWLKSGGYLVIEPTEALTVIDVNSGKYDRGKESQDAYLKVNLEAAEEVALQLRLRNISGIVIVDFINMRSPSDNIQLLHTLKALVKRDRVQTSVIDMTPLGLVEITRKKISRPLWEQVSHSSSQEE